MKPLFVHERFGAFGGAEANALLTAGELKRRGHTVGLLHGPGTGHGEDDWRETFARCFPLAAKSNWAVVQSALWDFEPDLIYVHKIADLEVMEALVASGIPLVRMVHDHDLYCMRSYKYNFFSRKICKQPASWRCVFPCAAFLARNRTGKFPFKWISYFAKRREIRLTQQFQRIIVATHYMRDELLRNGFEPDRIEIHAPVPRPGDTSLRSTFSDRNLIIFAGQIIRGKGVDVLIQALAQIAVPFQCIILGEGNHKPYCQALSSKLGLGGRVHFKGFIPQAELKNYYRECSVVVMSSVWPEPFGATGLEGMHHGLPVVAFDAGGIREWLIDGYNGYLVPWMNRGKFATRVQELLLDKELAREMGERALRLVTHEYDFAHYIAALESTFAQVIEEAH